ncbi:hypothetical protein J31TS4_44230 [Paenibacillus sp. J31TS4]|uniref:hypothetical protein n=1 Tax=Paenibacillus sp. J31TS4 TaxID=2807195 RepID=UPI001B1ADD0D|nr:hypothetical protein [Paenibacillus sp. J31TS4]GIP41143.1 hypothetical protein J31TS4_44230 [Paenibacillus sp. J31TS4]
MKQILVFLLFAAMLCWFMFAPIYKHVLIMRQAVLQKETDYLLEIGANGRHGYIDAAMMAESRRRLEDAGFRGSDVSYEVTTTSGAPGTDPTRPVPRGTGIRLEMRYPYDGLFDIDRLIGISPAPDGGFLGAAGMKMSEYVP